MVIFHSYVKLPEGRSWLKYGFDHVWSIHMSDSASWQRRSEVPLDEWMAGCVVRGEGAVGGAVISSQHVIIWRTSKSKEPLEFVVSSFLLLLNRACRWFWSWQPRVRRRCWKSEGWVRENAACSTSHIISAIEDPQAMLFGTETSQQMEWSSVLSLDPRDPLKPGHARPSGSAASHWFL